MRSSLRVHVAGGEAAHPAIRTYADFQAWARGGCFVDPENDLPRFRWYTVGQFLEWAHARRWDTRRIERTLAAVGRVLGVDASGNQQTQGALNGQVFTGATTAFTVPDATNFMCPSGYGGGGGGGSGGSSAAPANGGAGGGGSMAGCLPLASTPGAGITVTCGAGGTAGTAATGTAGNAGGPGGDSLFPGTSVTSTFGGASGGGPGSAVALQGGFGGRPVKLSSGNNLYDANSAISGGGTGAIPPSSAAWTVNQPGYTEGSGGGGTPSGGTGKSGIGQRTGGFSGGTGGTPATAGGGGGGGPGPGANGGNGGNGVASGVANAGASPAANTGAGAGGGGGQATAATASGPGGVGGSGEVTAVW